MSVPRKEKENRSASHDRGNGLVWLAKGFVTEP
jgi:hypothetical protein